MRNPEDVCHIAIACDDLDLAVDFYQSKLGCKMARRKNDRVTFNFFGDQLVCHLSPSEVRREIKTYPYHFGMTFSNLNDFESFLALIKDNDVNILQNIKRFEGKSDEHRTVFFSDPFNNVLEFKYYFNDDMKY